ncbi:uncharacterized protein [Typha angustifolia]|uniref:uncharacterized protein n=1 Tax=Typha angustifolia TaxID=59011 RepID=UPI003C2AB5B2
MLSGIKFVPKDQLLAAKPGSNSDDSGEESKDLRRTKARNVGKEKKEKSKRRRRRKGRRSKRYSSESEEETSSSEEEKSKRRRRKSKKRNFSEEDSYSSDESEEGKSGSRRRGKNYDEYSDEETGGEDGKALLSNEIARKEMGLEWMLKSATRSESSQPEQEEEPEPPVVEEVKKTNPRELNPYLKDNGSGYPDDAALPEGGDKLLSSSVVGDGGASWRLKALKRAKEQATREGRKLDDIVQERWGSLGQLAGSVAASRVAPSHAHLHAIKNRKRAQAGNDEDVRCNDLKGDADEVRTSSRDYLRDISSRHPEMRKPRQEFLSWKRNKGQNISSQDKSLISAAISDINKFSNDGSFMDNIDRLQKKESKDAAVSSSSRVRLEATEDIVNKLSSLKDEISDKVSSVNTQALTANQLAAKVLQLRMKGKHDEADKLSKEMEAVAEKQDSDTKVMRQEIVQRSSRHISSDRKKREDDADWQLARTIMQNKKFSLSGRAEDEYDFDVAPSKKSKKRRDEALEENFGGRKPLLTQKERCQFCFENPSRPKHLVVSIANFTYLMLPQWQPVVQGHCIILPLQHESATRTVDRNTWEEIRNFKKCLLKMFAKQDKDAVFLETVISLAKQRRHCLIECIPIPYQISNKAPMYFKKAIDEAEDEWGQHEMKKLIPTSGNLRQVIPENFAYFHVEFGLDRGFVHVIDDESNFNSGFGLNVIRGILQLSEEDMYRRRRQEPVEKQKQAVAAFLQEWEPFDWTRDLD